MNLAQRIGLAAILWGILFATVVIANPDESPDWLYQATLYLFVCGTGLFVASKETRRNDDR